MTEFEEAIALANRVLDRPNADPDSSLAMLARQFLRGLEREGKLRKALSGLVGAETREGLEQVELGVRVLPAPDADKVSSLNAIHALLETVYTATEYEKLAKGFRDSTRGEAEGTPESLARCARMLDTYAPDLYPANEKGQVHFARAIMESAADEIRKFLHQFRQGDPMGDLIQSNRDQMLKMHEEAAQRVRKALEPLKMYGSVLLVLNILDALRTFHPMHGESWKGWPEGSE